MAIGDFRIQVLLDSDLYNDLQAALELGLDDCRNAEQRERMQRLQKTIDAGTRMLTGGEDENG